MKKESVLITGGAGYLGSTLSEYLLKNDYSVTIYDNLMYNQSSLLHLFKYKNFNFIFGDVRDKKKLQSEVSKHNVVIPLAAIVGMPACNLNPKLAEDVNYVQILDIIEVLSKDQKIILPNTNSQYGSSESIITEESPFNPLSLYAETKCNAEKALIDSGNGITLRLATVFGISPRMRFDLLVNDFVYKSINDGYLVLFESNFKRNYIHVLDIARTFEFMIRNYEKCNNQSFNVGLSNANLSKLELALKIKEYIPNLVIKEDNFKEDFDKRNYIVSNEKIESMGWVPQFTLDDGIKELLSSFKIFKKINDSKFTNL